MVATFFTFLSLQSGSLLLAEQRAEIPSQQHPVAQGDSRQRAWESVLQALYFPSKGDNWSCCPVRVWHGNLRQEPRQTQISDTAGSGFCGKSRGGLSHSIISHDLVSALAWS